MPTYLGNKKMQLMLNGKRYIVETQNKIHYVSLGDSIAAGHTINAEWETNYGERSQYWYKISDNVYRTEPTVIVQGSYTDLISKDLMNQYGMDYDVSVLSFARSGDTVADLLAKLDHEKVRKAISRANVVTICIGANDALQPAMHNLEDYINTGSMETINSVVENNIAILSNDSSANSYKALFDKLNAINPRAKYVFTTIYNPYKYLWIEEGHNGFFKPILDLISQYIPIIDVDKQIENLFGIDDLSYYDVTKLSWVSIELELDLASLIKDGILSTTPFQTLFSRVNGLCDWSEKFVEGTSNFNGINRVLRSKIAEYQSVNPNFFVAETKTLFDTYPDRPEPAEIHYNDLVNVEYTRGYNTMTMDWGQLWGDKDVATFWTDLAWKHLHFASYDRIIELAASFSTNVWDYVSFDMTGFAKELVDLIVQRVIVPDVDPHPESYGHVVLRNSFTNALT